MVLRLQQCRADNLAALKRQNESVLDMLARERVASDALRQRCEELEADLQECGTTYEVLAHFSQSRPCIAGRLPCRYRWCLAVKQSLPERAVLFAGK